MFAVRDIPTCNGKLLPFFKINSWLSKVTSAGKIYWEGTHAVLVSKSGFTKSAQKLARANKVKLINEYELQDLENILIK